MALCGACDEETPQQDKNDAGMLPHRTTLDLSSRSSSGSAYFAKLAVKTTTCNRQSVCSGPSSWDLSCPSR